MIFTNHRFRTRHVLGLILVEGMICSSIYYLHVFWIYVASSFYIVRYFNIMSDALGVKLNVCNFVFVWRYSFSSFPNILIFRSLSTFWIAFAFNVKPSLFTILLFLSPTLTDEPCWNTWFQFSNFLNFLFWLFITICFYMLFSCDWFWCDIYPWHYFITSYLQFWRLFHY